MSDKDPKKDGGGHGHGSHDRRPPPERTGHVRPTNPDLVTWLERLWTRDNPPDRLEVWWMIGEFKDHKHRLVFYENFTQGKDLNIEECGRLCGEMLKAVQDWTDGKRRLCSFEIFLTDFYQQVIPLCKTIGPLLPQTQYAGVHPDGEPTGADEDGEGGGGLKPLSHKYLSKTIRSVHRTMEETHAIIGDTMRMMQAIMLSQQSHNERLQNANMALYDQKQIAEDRGAEREVWVRKEQAKVKAIEKSLTVGTNLVYGWLGMPTAAETTVEGGQGAGQGQALSARRHPGSPEQKLVESFLEEAAEEKLSIQLFGDWKDTANLTLQEVLAGLGLQKPGIFTPQQFGILLAVRAGVLPPEALDSLLHDSGQPQAITAEQTLLAQPLLTQGMAVALVQIRQLRLAARDKREAQQQQQNGAQT